MRYFLAIIFPPLAVLFCGKPFSAILNLILTCLGWFPGVIHAFFVVNSHKNERALKRIERKIVANTKTTHRDSVQINNSINKKG